MAAGDQAMTQRVTPHRLGRLSFALMASSIAASAAVSVAMDAVFVRLSTDSPTLIVAGVVLFNGTAIMLSSVGAIIEWQRPGPRDRAAHDARRADVRDRLGGLDHDRVAPTTDRPDGLPGLQLDRVQLSWSAMALIIGWIPLLFPTGDLPGPRWRAPAALTLALLGLGLFRLAFRPGSSWAAPTS